MTQRELADIIRARMERDGLTQSGLARSLGEGSAFQALISKLLRGESVSAETARRVGRALGILPPPRRLVRRCMTPAQALAWDALTHAERDALLGIPSP